MKRLSILLLTLVSPACVIEGQCDCTTYPFKPNPPCYGTCVKRLSANKDIDLSKVKNLDAGVSVGIKVLAENPALNTDFNSIRGKRDLEKAALASMSGSRRAQ